MSRGSVTIVIMAFVTLSFIIYVNEGINGFTLWNSLPIFIALIVLLVDKSMKGLKYAVYGFACTIITAIFVVHVSYLIDMGKLLSIPSLSGQRLYGLPMYSIGAGYIVGMIGLVFGAVHDRNNEKQPNTYKAP
jgi:hypothetical protein